ncbi:hypothetical protein SPRG_16989 [Saprolegnia parasitica CBS 223.65]|uniref:Uncharacterized protein n=1 Tax=Saprolegnia parasitica (strain CBS 223.65) TaxID=695850 RepID=A0A067BS41_SAPPC|nr:hypothetical protein SPRG_16989 [Saprolegnia parasitica CBS 223.65]KDO17492.1 hypothetical protein SPRG_16989 [Saprolegnia parasitica CBS 223.65]|eukprot:XP_012211797.1 hypothetical protein SPRG_16989 [Saprolegnia parasitica CBS 223.65]
MHAPMNSTVRHAARHWRGAVNGLTTDATADTKQVYKQLDSGHHAQSRGSVLRAEPTQVTSNGTREMSSHLATTL